jgi:hypothetical protein
MTVHISDLFYKNCMNMPQFKIIFCIQFIDWMVELWVNSNFITLYCVPCQKGIKISTIEVVDTDYINIAQAII